MPSPLRCALCFIVACASVAQTLDWIGQTFDGSAVTLWSLKDDGTHGAARGSVTLPAGSAVGVDLFRCQPYGRWCQFIATSSAGAATLYNVSVTNAGLAGSVALPPADRIVSLHIDANTGISYFTALTGAGAQILSVRNDGTATTVVDLSSYLVSGATVKPGGATHCSNKKLMWVTISNSTGGVILTVDYSAGKVTAQQRITFPGFSSMWADCGEFVVTDDIVQGTVFNQESGVLAYGGVTATGDFHAVATGTGPAGLVPNGVLTFADVFTTNYNYVAALYPPTASPGPTPANGYLAFFAEGGPGMTFLPVAYYLAGASLS